MAHTEKFVGTSIIDWILLAKPSRPGTSDLRSICHWAELCACSRGYIFPQMKEQLQSKTNSNAKFHDLSVNAYLRDSLRAMAQGKVIGPSVLACILLLAVCWTHVFLAPYTKVEETFSLHAVHDLLYYGPEASQLPKVQTNFSCLSLFLICSMLSMIMSYIEVLFRARSLVPSHSLPLYGRSSNCCRSELAILCSKCSWPVSSFLSVMISAELMLSLSSSSPASGYSERF